jgi:hypothetical protein
VTTPSVIGVPPSSLLDIQHSFSEGEHHNL